MVPLPMILVVHYYPLQVGRQLLAFFVIEAFS
jgi:hypothetical protein